MNKMLAGATAALCGAALAVPAFAQVSITGSMTHDFGFGSYIGGATATDDFHQEISAELAFKATGTTDGGLTMTAVMELDADSGAGVDESHLTIGGGFGEIIIGAQDNAANRLGNKGVGGGYGGGGYYDCGQGWHPASCAGQVGSGDHLGVQYTTPNMAGFQAGISFQPDSSGEGATDAMNDSNVVAVGANFTGDFVGSSVTLGVGLKSSKSGETAATTAATHADGTTTHAITPAVTVNDVTTEEWGMGATFKVGTTTLSLRYDVDSAAVGPDTKSYGVGVDHVIGSISFGVGYGMNQMPGADHSVLAAGVEYVLGGGAKVSGGINAGEVDNDIGADVDDVGVGMRIALSF